MAKKEETSTPEVKVKKKRGRPRLNKEPVVKEPKRRGRPPLNAPKVKKESYLTADTAPDRRKLLVRAAKIRGQINGLERVIFEEKSCEAIFNQATAIKGGVDALMKMILDEHLKKSFVLAETKAQREEQTAHLISILKSYFKQM